MPPKSSVKSSSKKSASGSHRKAKQATLEFPLSRKGSNASNGSKAGKQGGKLSRTNSALKPTTTDDDDEDDEDIEVEESEGNSFYGEVISSDEEKLTKFAKHPALSLDIPNKTRAFAAAANRKRLNADPPITELSDKSGRWNRHYAEVREKMGHMHASPSLQLFGKDSDSSFYSSRGESNQNWWHSSCIWSVRMRVFRDYLASWVLGTEPTIMAHVSVYLEWIGGCVLVLSDWIRPQPWVTPALDYALDWFLNYIGSRNHGNSRRSRQSSL